MISIVGRRLALLLALSANAALLWHFHDRYWYPTDDGFYANIAERVLSGEALGRDVQDIHPGYIHAINAAAMWLFGLDMVSPRYPLIAAALAQAILVLALLKRISVAVAAAASIAVTALGVVQFFNPTPNWYCLLLAVAIAAWLTSVPTGHPWRLFGAGILLGILTMFRQLSGVWAAMALLVITYLEVPPATPAARGTLAKGIILVMLASLLWYLAVSPETEPGGLILMAASPLIVLGLAWRRVRITDRQALRMTVQVAAGATCAALPLIIYHTAHDSFGQLFRDTVLAGFNETQMSFFGRGWYGVLPLAGLQLALTSFAPVKIANGLYWVLLPVLSLWNGILVVRALARAEPGAPVPILPMVAAFYALVSLYFEGPLYLYYSAGLSLAGVTWFVAPRYGPIRVATVLLLIAGIAVGFHAAQPRHRTPAQILSGERTAQWDTARPLPRATLKLSPEDQRSYGALVSVIERESAPGESILALPNDAELYFLARRRNPVRFYNSALGVQREEELDDVMRLLERAPPRLVMFRPDDKYITPFTRRIVDAVRARYKARGQIEGLDVYVLDDARARER